MLSKPTFAHETLAVRVSHMTGDVQVLVTVDGSVRVANEQNAPAVALA